MSALRISVVMATKNAARYLHDALDSVAAQTRPADEIVVVDGGSADGTREIASSYPNVRLIDETGSGFASAWNDGMDAARGDAIAFLDSDDRWEPRKLEWQAAALEAAPEAMGAIGHVRFFMGPNQQRPPGFKLELLDGDYVAPMPGALLARRALFERVGRFDTHWAIASDIDWFAKVKDLGCRIEIVPRVVIHKRVHDSNLSYVTATTPVMNQEILKLLRQSIHRQRTGATKGEA
jgi:glycosyltransferase involved in cell wall biosynthesis